MVIVAVSAALAAGGAAMSMFAPSASARGEPANFVRWRPGLSSSAQPDALYLARATRLGTTP